MTTGYVILKVDFEYNDNNYYKNSEAGGIPIEIYLNKERAKVEMDRLEMQEFIKSDIGFYCEELADLINDIDKFNVLIKKYDEDQPVFEGSEQFNDWFVDNIRNFSPEDQKAMYDLIGINFFCLNEIEIKD